MKVIDEAREAMFRGKNQRAAMAERMREAPHSNGPLPANVAAAERLAEQARLQNSFQQRRAEAIVRQNELGQAQRRERETFDRDLADQLRSAEAGFRDAVARFDLDGAVSAYQRMTALRAVEVERSQRRR